MVNDKILVIDLPKHKTFRCDDCKNTFVQIFPQYPYSNDKREFLGLERKKD